MSDLYLVVNGLRYKGWKSIRVTRSIESLAGSFSLEATDRWGGQGKIWPIKEEDTCRVLIDDEVVIDGFVDTRDLSISATSRSLSYSGKDRAAALVECSALLKTWSFAGASLFDVATKLAAPFGITVSLESGFIPPKPKKKEVVNPGETPFEVLHRLATSVGALLVSDGAGGIVITRASSSRAAALVQGENVLTASVKYDATQRFRRYVVTSQVSATNYLEDNTNATAEAVTKIRAEATDPGVRRAERVLVIQPETGLTADYAKRRADWEARVRAAKAESPTVSVRGWKQPGGALWPVNAQTTVSIPSLEIQGEMVISEVEFSVGTEGEITQMKLVRPDAFSPEPEAVVDTGGGAWKDIAKGVH